MDQSQSYLTGTVKEKNGDFFINIKGNDLSLNKIKKVITMAELKKTQELIEKFKAANTDEKLMKAYIDMLYYYESEKWHTDYKGILTAAGGLNLEIKGNQELLEKIFTNQQETLKEFWEELEKINNENDVNGQKLKKENLLQNEFEDIKSLLEKNKNEIMKASVAKYVNECKGHVKNFDKLDNRMKAVILSQQYVGNYYFKKTKNGTGQCHKYVTKEQNVDDIKEIMKIMYDNADDGKRTMSDVILLDSYRVEI